MYLLAPGGWRNQIRGKLVISNGVNTSPFNTQFYMGAATVTDPTVQSQAAYLQHRISGNLGGYVHDAVAAELRVAGASNQGTALNAFEASVVLPSGASTLTNLRAVTANLSVSAGVTGTLTSAQMVRCQQVGALPGGFTIDTLHSLYVESQTVATTNYSIYVSGGNSVIPAVISPTTTSVGMIFKTITSQTAAAWVVQSAAGTAIIQAFADPSLGVGGQISNTSLWVNNNVAPVGNCGIIVKTRSGQTGDMQRWQDNSDVIKLRVTPGGWLRLTAVTNASPSEGDLWYDGTNLRFRDATTTRTISW